MPETPDRPPTWTEVVVSVGVLALIVSQVTSAVPLTPTGVALGVLTTWFVAAPLARSSTGRRIDAWGTDAGPVASTVAIVGAAIALPAVSTALEPWTLSGFLVGFMLGTIGWFLVHFASTGDVSGWS